MATDYAEITLLIPACYLEHTRSMTEVRKKYPGLVIKHGDVSQIVVVGDAGTEQFKEVSLWVTHHLPSY